MRAIRPLAFAVLLLAAPAYAGWTPGGVTIKSTTSNIPAVQACSDGADGSFVVWQEDPGVLRLQHVLGSGDLEGTWSPEGLSAAVSPRPGLG